MSSSAFFRLAAANTRISLPCAAAEWIPAVHANPAATSRASQERLGVIAGSICACPIAASILRYIGQDIASMAENGCDEKGCQAGRAVVSLPRRYRHWLGYRLHVAGV